MLTASMSSTLTGVVRMLSAMAETVGERLRRARDEAGLTQEQLAQDIGATRSAISQVELGISNSLNAENLTKAAQRTGKNPKWLATGEGPENDPSALGAILQEFSDDTRQQTFDFIEYQIDRAKDTLGADKVNSYHKMIERIKADMAKKKKGK